MKPSAFPVPSAVVEDVRAGIMVPASGLAWLVTDVISVANSGINSGKGHFLI